ncbi:LuxR C-terminal-related transcriptional regulator [Nocardia sp. NPDC051570]|uniref:helix-turn-helix transcriptional regulator n=1 Tax=Nocardia sp. NPDC051570 TaxID=3364324 RepID=UPI00378BDBC0
MARAIAVLGELASVRRVAALVGMPPAAVESAVDELTAGGLVENLRFRDSTAVSALCGDLEPVERTSLHGRAARLLFLEGRESTEIAEHLCSADDVAQKWGLAALRQAAADAAVVDDVDRAMRYLNLALRYCDDEQVRHEISLAIARVEWRGNPAAALRQIGLLAIDVRSGGLDGRDTATVIAHLMWQGDLAAASECLAAMPLSWLAANPRVVAELTFVRHWFYGVVSAPPKHFPKNSAAAGLARLVADGLWPKTVALVGGVATEETVTDLAHVLRSSRLDEMSLEIAATALLVLTVVDHGDISAELCNELVAEAERRRFTTWQALLSSIRGEIALLQGDVALAEEKAVAALDMMSAESWGVLIGLPLSTAIHARAALGRYTAAAALLNRRVPESMFRTVFGARYLRARGDLFLTTDRASAAVNDFETCGQLMRDKNPAMQTLVPWRIDLAYAHIVMGRADQAKKLAEKQLELTNGLGSQLKAASLRALAASLTGQPRSSAAALREAIQLFEASGDNLGMARALADLSMVYHELGEFDQARLVAEQCAEKAEQCRIDIPTAYRSVGSTSIDTENLDAGQVLSDAEKRVAALAAIGYTNREISERLHLTVSTVEQHLTRSYKKLGVSRRSELPAKVRQHQIPILTDARSRAARHRDTDGVGTLQAVGDSARRVWSRV